MQLKAGYPSRTSEPARSSLLPPTMSQHRHRRPNRWVAGARAVSASTTSSISLPALPPLDERYEERCTFTSFGNWLIPGRLMLGRYPFIEPSRCRSREMGEAQLKQLLEAGITTFICLQEELPPQAELTVGGHNGFQAYKPIAGLLAASLAPPPSQEQFNGLRTPDLDKFLPPRRKAVADPEAAAARISRDLTFLHHPIVDLGLPEPDILEGVLSDLRAQLEEGRGVYLHCWGGRGRAGTVGAAFLRRAYGLGADEALDRIQRAFSTRRDNIARSPETDEQQAFIRALAACQGS